MAGYQDIFLNQGETFSTTLTLDDMYGEPYNLTDFVVASQAKKSYYSANAVINFVTTVVDANNGTIQLSANAATTANVSASSKLVYDVVIMQTFTGNVTRVLEGQIIVSPGVTLTLS
jgi:hypothetical protein